MEKHHYVYGSGMSGCLFDFGPHFCEDKEDAIESFVQLFGDCIDDSEESAMREALAQDGIYYFKDACEAGAQYASISRQNGACPVENDDGSYTEVEENDDDE